MAIIVEHITTRTNAWPRPVRVARLGPTTESKLAQLSGIKRYSRDLPSIQIGGQLAKSRYQYTLQGPDADELHQGSPLSAVVGGMLFAPSLTLFVTLVFYLYMEGLRARVARWRSVQPQSMSAAQA